MYKDSQELENLKKKVYQTKQNCSNEFAKINKSLPYKSGFHKDKAFQLTLHQIKQLAQTPVGYGLSMLEIFADSDKQLKKEKEAMEE